MWQHGRGGMWRHIGAQWAILGRGTHGQCYSQAPPVPCPSSYAQTAKLYSPGPNPNPNPNPHRSESSEDLNFSLVVTEPDAVPLVPTPLLPSLPGAPLHCGSPGAPGIKPLGRFTPSCSPLSLARPHLKLLPLPRSSPLETLRPRAALPVSSPASQPANPSPLNHGGAGEAASSRADRAAG